MLKHKFNSVTFYCREETKEQINLLKRSGINISELLRNAVAAKAKKLEAEENNG